MKRKPILKIKLADAIREAVRRSALSHAEICRTSGIDEAAFSRFLSSSKGISLAGLDRLVDVLGLRLVARGRNNGKAHKKGR